MKQIPMSRRALLQGAAGLAAAVWLPQAAAAATAGRVEVWKDPNCGCCGDWIAHMQRNGFQVQVHQDAGGTMRRRLGVPQQFASCHTAKIGRYWLEGHVPAAEVRRLLREQPDALGLAVPGMPIGSPGMDGAAYGGRKMPYQVLLVKRDGSSSVFRVYGK